MAILKLALMFIASSADYCDLFEYCDDETNVGDGNCDIQCMSEDCSYDSSSESSSLQILLENSDCYSSCISACSFYKLGDGKCDSECDIAECIFDLNDCGYCDECLKENVGNGVCDDDCFNEECNWDGGDCEYCNEECSSEAVNNDQCDDVCDTSSCNYDNGYCGCSEDCKVEDYGTCQEGCLVPSCSFDPDCSDNYAKFTAVAKYLLMVDSYSTEELQNNCTDCSEDDLIDGYNYVCKQDKCTNKYCLFQLGGCSNDDGCAKDCKRCANNYPNLCLECINNKFHLFGECLDFCPAYYKPIDLCFEDVPCTSETKYRLCVPDFHDTSTPEDPQIFYVKSNPAEDDYTAFSALEDALDYFWNRYTRIKLEEGEYNVTRTIIQESRFDGLNLIIESDTTAILKLKLTDFQFPTNLASLTLRNVILDGSQAIKNDCSADLCKYCPYYVESDGKYYNDRGELISDINEYNKDECSGLNSKAPMSGSFKLSIENCEIREMRFKLSSIIEISNNNVFIKDTRFANVSAEYDSSSAVIDVSCELNKCDFLFDMQGGSVEFVNNGFEYRSGIVQYPFVKIEQLQSISFNNVEFKGNALICDSECLGFIEVQKSFALHVNNCKFESSIFMGSLISFNNRGTILEYLVSVDPLDLCPMCDEFNVKIEKNQFNDVVSRYVMFISEDVFANNIQISENSFTNSMGLNLISIENDSSSTDHSAYELNVYGEDEILQTVPLTKRITAIELNTYQEVVFQKVVSISNRNYSKFKPSEITLSANGDPQTVLQSYKDLPESYMLKDITSLPSIHFSSFLEGIQLEDLEITCTIGFSQHSSYFFDLSLIYGEVSISSSSFASIHGSLISVSGIDGADLIIDKTDFKDISGTNILYTDGINDIEMDKLTFANLEVEKVAYLNKIENLEILDTSIFNITAESGSQGALYLNLDDTERNIVKITNSNFTSCESVTDGGVIYITSSYQDEPSLQLQIKNSRFEENNAEYSGSVLYFNTYITLSESYIETSYFIKNKGYSDGTLRLYNIAGKLVIKDCVFEENESDTEIYATHINSGRKLELQVVDTNFTRNIGKSTILAQCQRGDTIDIFKSIFEQNEGASISLNECNSDTEKNTFTMNQSPEGFILLENDSDMDFDDSVFESNISSSPSAIIVKDSEFNAKDSYFNSNSEELIMADMESELEIDKCYIYNHQYSSNALISLYNNSTMTIVNSEIYTSSATRATLIIDTAELKLKDVTMYNNTALENLSVSNSKVEIEESSISDTNHLSVSFIHATGTSEIEIDDSYFKNSTDAVSAFRIEYSTLKVENCSFEDIKSLDAGAIYSYESTLEVKNSQFYNIYTDTEGSAIAAYYSSLTLHDSSIDSFNRSAVYSEFSDLSIVNSMISNGNRGITAYELSLFDVSESHFSDLDGPNGGGVFAKNDQVFSVDDASIKNTTFEYSSAANGGGIYAENVNLAVEDSTFLLNNATNFTTFNPYSQEISDGKGGGICFESARNNTFEVKDCLFIGNSAVYKGGAISYTGTSPVFQNNTFESNSAYYGPDLAGYAVSIVYLDTEGNVVDREKSSLDFVTPGQAIDSFLLAVVDGSNQIVTTENSDTIGFRSNNEATVSGTTVVEISQGVANFTSLMVLASPGSSVHLEADSGKVDVVTGNPIVPILLNLDLMSCVPGEVTKEDECQKCLEGTYSLAPIERVCRPCPDTAYCYEEDKIVPLKDYWRSSKYSHDIWECPIPDSCLGGLEDENGEISRTGRCRDGHKGNMCQSCEEGFTHNALRLCDNCPDFATNVVFLCLSFIALCVVLVVVVAASLATAKEEMSLHSVYIKIFINYIQLVSLIATFDLEWPSLVRSFLSFFTIVNGAGDVILSFECFIGDQDDGYYAKLVIVAISPLVMAIIACSVWFIISSIKKDYVYMKRELVSTLVVLFFILHPVVVVRLFNSLNCIEIEEDEYWLNDHRDISCWDSTHFFYIFIFSVPGLILWGIMLPCICLFYLYKNSDNLEDPLMKLQFGFLYNGFTTRAYFWEFTIILRKFLIIVCSVFVKKISVMVQALNMLIIVLVSLYIHERFKPYREVQLNVMEKRSILVCFITIFCGLFYLTEDLSEVSEIVLFGVILCINFYFLESWIVKLFKSGILYLRKYSWFRRLLKNRVRQDVVLTNFPTVPPTNNMKGLFMNALRDSVNQLELARKEIPEDNSLNFFDFSDKSISRARSDHFSLE